VAEVKTVIEVALKEARVEKKLQVIESVWGTQVLELRAFKDSGIKILQSPDEVVEYVVEGRSRSRSPSTRRRRRREPVHLAVSF
jgi:hypothetical protein